MLKIKWMNNMSKTFCIVTAGIISKEINDSKNIYYLLLLSDSPTVGLKFTLQVLWNEYLNGVM